MTGNPRLDHAFERYAALIAAELEALEAGELEALESLASQRDELATEIDRAAATDEPADGPALHAALERCRDADVRLRAKIATLRTHTLDAVRRNARDASAARSYAASAQTGAKLDIEL